MKDRALQAVLIASTCGFCWLGMQAVHELGHVVAAWSSGETVHRVVLHPLTISRTDASHDHHPLLVIGGGPLLGVLLPLAACATARFLRSRLFYLVQFFTGFCLIANGAYLGTGVFGGVGDAGDLLRSGAPPWTLILFGLVSVPAGLTLWNGLGPHFALGTAGGKVDPTAVSWAAGLLVALVLMEIFVGWALPTS